MTEDDWRRVEGWIAPALTYGGETHTFEDVRADIEARRAQLWTGPDGAAVTQVLAYPRKKVLHVFAAGGAMGQILDFEETAAAWGRAVGCEAMTLTGRRGWQRVLGRRGWQFQSLTMGRNI